MKKRIFLLLFLLILVGGAAVYLLYPVREEISQGPLRIIKRVKIEPPGPEIEATLKEEKKPVPEKEVREEAKAKTAPEVEKPRIEPVEKGKIKAPKRPETPKKVEEKRVSKKIGEKRVRKETRRAGTWAVNLTSTGSEKEAREIAAKLRKRGYNSYVTAYRSKEGIVWYRVRVGFFPTRERAGRVAEEIRKKLGLKDYWVVKPSREEVKRFAGE